MVGPRLLGRLYCGVTTTGHPHLYGGVEELWLKGFGFGLSGFSMFATVDFRDCCFCVCRHVVIELSVSLAPCLSLSVSI